MELPMGYVLLMDTIEVLIITDLIKSEFIILSPFTIAVLVMVGCILSALIILGIIVLLTKVILLIFDRWN